MTLRLPLRFLAASALALATVAVPGTARATPTAGVSTTGEGCPGDTVCMLTERWYGGRAWDWETARGAALLPYYLHDHVGTIDAGTTACLLKFQPHAALDLVPGFHDPVFMKGFGSHVDAIMPGPCTSQA